MLSRWIPTGVFAVALVLAGASINEPNKPVFQQGGVADRQSAAAQPILFSWSDLPHPTLSAHAATLAEITSGPSSVQLVAAWFGGTREGAADVSLYQSTWISGSNWQPAKEIMTRDLAERQLGRNVRKLGNPLLIASPGRLQLFFVSVSYGGWAGSAINLSDSQDGGLSWTPARRIVTSPFFNLSTLVRNPGSWYTDGSLGLPVYHEFISKHGEWLRLSPEGRVLGKSRMAMPRPTLQPAVVSLGPEYAVAALRDSGPGPNQIQWSETRDGGQSWTQKSARTIPNPNSAAAMISLQDGTLLMACNPIPGNRNQLSLLRSLDQG